MSGEPQQAEAWQAAGKLAEAAVRARQWEEADKHAELFCSLRPDWPKGYLLRRLTMTRLGRSPAEIAITLRYGLSCVAASDARAIQDALESLELGVGVQASAGGHAVIDAELAPPKAKFKSKVKGLKLLPHEQALFEAGELEDITHAGSSAIWLSAPLAAPISEDQTLVYRPMGDAECEHLRAHGLLPGTQPYQTIVEGAEGRAYAEKYLRGQKSVDSSPTTVVEFVAPRGLVRRLFDMQSKNEDGAISHGRRS